MHETASTTIPIRGAVYRMLARLWATELTEPTVQLLASPDVSDVWQSLGGCDPELLTPDRLDDLAEDYCRLFVGPTGHLPPIQSVWADGELQSDVVTSLTEFVSVCGYESPWSGQLPDHLGNELQLMGLALAKASLETESAAIDDARQFTATLLDRHLRWALPFAAQVTRRDEDGFYGQLALVTRAFLQSEDELYFETGNT